MKNPLTCKSSERTEVAFSIQFEMFMMIELYILDENQHSVSLATGSV